MTDGLYLDPQRTVDGAKDLAASGKNLATQRKGVGEELRTLSGKKPWGTDDIGAAFDKEYAPMEEKVLLAWTQLAAYVEGLGEAAAQSVQLNMQADVSAGERVINTYKNT
jgi:hypothetical protein